MTWLKQSTAVEVPVGPFLDEDDGKTQEPGLTITQADVRLKKGDADWGQKNEATTLVHEEAGWYRCLLDDTDTNTLGRLQLAIHETGALPVWREFEVLPAVVYDSLIAGSDFLQTDLQEWVGVAPLALTSQRVQTSVAAMQSNVLNAAAIAADAIQAAKIQDGALTAAKFASGAFDAVWSVAARLLTAGTNIVLAKGVGVTGFNDLSAAQVNAEADQALVDYDALVPADIPEIVDQVWDEALTGGTHNVPTSSGRRLRQIADISIIHSGTAAAGGDDSITLDGGASADDDAYQLNYITISEGTGAGQTRVCVDYDGNTKVAKVSRNWATNPSTDSVFVVIANANSLVEHVGGVAAAGASTITLQANASPNNESYVGSTIMIATGTGREQTRIIVSYNGTSKVATISTPWSVQPDTTSTYIIWPFGRAFVIGASALGEAAIADAVLKRDIDNVEVAAPIHSLASLILKGVSRIEFDDTGDTLTVYRTDGTTAKFTQATTQGAIQPITELGVAT
jgi:hypothetical protein